MVWLNQDPGYNQKHKWKSSSLFIVVFLWVWRNLYLFISWSAYVIDLSVCRIFLKKFFISCISGGSLTNVGAIYHPFEVFSHFWEAIILDTQIQNNKSLSDCVVLLMCKAPMLEGQFLFARTSILFTSCLDSRIGSVGFVLFQKTFTPGAFKGQGKS